MIKRTVHALYEDETRAGEAREQLAAAGFHDVKIVAHHEGLLEMLERLVGVDHWRSAIERGHVMLVAHVDAFRSGEAAEIVDATSLGQIVHEAH